VTLEYFVYAWTCMYTKQVRNPVSIVSFYWFYVEEHMIDWRRFVKYCLILK